MRTGASYAIALAALLYWPVVAKSSTVTWIRCISDDRRPPDYILLVGDDHTLYMYDEDSHHIKKAVSRTTEDGSKVDVSVSPIEIKQDLIKKNGDGYYLTINRLSGKFVQSIVDSGKEVSFRGICNPIDPLPVDDLKPKF